MTARWRLDVALVGLGLHCEHALELISEIVREASCPVIGLLSAKDPAYVGEAAKRGVFAYIADGSPEELRSAIDITLQRFAEYHSASGRDVERAPGTRTPMFSTWKHATSSRRSAREHRPSGCSPSRFQIGRRDRGRNRETKVHANRLQNDD